MSDVRLWPCLSMALGQARGILANANVAISHMPSMESEIYHTNRWLLANCLLRECQSTKPKPKPKPKKRGKKGKEK
jgi:hypothetical protein